MSPSLIEEMEMTPPSLKDFTLWAEEITHQLDAILQGQEDARRRMDDFIAVLKAKEDWDESVLATMNSMSEQILEVAGHSDEAVALAGGVRDKAALVAELLADAARHKSVEDSHREDHGQRTVRNNGPEDR